jgi:Raf kinase inhibitor-like YbhB/YbcL family protein
MLEKLPDAIGHALEHQRAGMEKILFNAASPVGQVPRIDVASPAFAEGAPIPPRFTADGAGLSPPLIWRNVPTDAATLALIVEDADSPTPQPLVHAIVVDIDPRDSGFLEGIFSGETQAGPQKLGLNSYLMHGWLPPDPPPGHGVHHYAFQVFALRDGEPLSKSPGRTEVMPDRYLPARSPGKSR